MAIEAPVSKYTRTNLLIYTAVLILMGGWFAYDGYFNQSFIEKHTKEVDGEQRPDSTLKFNRNSPPFFFAGAVILAVYFFMMKGRKVVADDEKLRLPGKEIPYDSIEAINKTHFDDRGFFEVIYRDADGQEQTERLSRKKYDDIQSVLDHLVSKIS